MHNVLTRIKARPQVYPSIELSYSPVEPVLSPVILNLPANGIRLRFDGPDQRLRLIEVLDFSKTPLTYKGSDLVRRGRSSDHEVESRSGPLFRHVYNRLFGPAHAGEYIPPDSATHGSYMLSYPGLAFCFPLLHSSWSERADFVSLLASSASSPATSMAIFQGASWAEARTTLFTKPPQYPRATPVGKKDIPDEIEEVVIWGQGQLEFVRRSLPAYLLVLGETTPQDLVAEFGPPDAIYRKNDTRIMIHGTDARLEGSLDRASESDISNSDSETELPTDKPLVNTECFYNYFHHGFDAFVSLPSTPSPPFPGDPARQIAPCSELRVTKILLHGNIPGSYPFNRHRRSRWAIHELVHSEMPFATISQTLKPVWRGTYNSAEEERSMQRGMVLNRGWGESPESSVEIVGGLEGLDQSAHALGNTELFGFPGLLFEILKNGAVSCLTVY